MKANKWAVWHMWRMIARCLFVLGALAGCGSGSVLAEDDPAFSGFPTDIVAERLADPVLQEVLASDNSNADRLLTAQLNMSYTISCRALLREYEDWTRTGRSPTVPNIMMPTSPAQGYESYMQKFFVEPAEGAIKSGDPANLRSWMLLYGACRDFVADPARSTTMTIADVLGGE